jgi:hypothetical protein
VSIRLCTVLGTPSPGVHVVVFGRQWLCGAAVVRILFGALWAVDAAFMWSSGFV